MSKSRRGPAWVVGAWARYEAQCLLEAFVLDRNPWHIIDAYSVLRLHRQKIPEMMHRNLEHAHRLLRVKKRGKPIPIPRNTVRDLDIVREIMVACGGDLPEEIPSDLAGKISRRHHMNEGNLRVILSRARVRRAGRSIR